MKKLLSVLLCVLMMAMLVPSAMAADKYANTLSDTVWNFSENDDISFYGVVGNATAPDAEGVTTPSVVAISDAHSIEGKALSITRGSDGKNIYFNFVDNTGNKVSADVLEIKYSFYVTGSDAMQKLVFKDGSATDDIVLKFQKQHITFLGQQVATNAYVKEKWYDVEILIDIPQGYGRLKFREHTSDNSKNWNIYHVLASNTEMASGGLKDMTKTNRIAIGLQDSSATLYIDNYYQYTAENVKPALLDADDFSEGVGTWSKGNFYTDATESKLRDGLSFETTGGVLSMSADGQKNGSNNSSIYKPIASTAISGAPENTNYIFKFKFGGTSNTNTIGASLGTATGNTETWLIRVQNNRLNMFTAIGGTITTGNQNFNSFGEITGNTLYEAEAVYNPTSGDLSVFVTNASGEQISGSVTLGGAPTKFAFRNHVAANVASTAYFDDFESGVLTGSPEFVSSTVASGEKNAASLDETAIFTYDRTILQSELAAAKVKLNDEVLTNDVDYTITSNGNQVMVTLKDLAKNTNYTVELTGVKDLAEVVAEEAATATFHTVAKDIEAEKPVLSGTTLSAKVYSYYAQGKKVKLIAALYNAEGTKLVNVAVKEFTVKERDGETISHDFSDVFSADGKKMGFVWSDFNTMIPYAAAYSN